MYKNPNVSRGYLTLGFFNEKNEESPGDNEYIERGANLDSNRKWELWIRL